MFVADARSFVVLSLLMSLAGPPFGSHSTQGPPPDRAAPVSEPANLQAQEGGTQVGTIEAVMAGQTRTFRVMEGPVDQGFATGWNQAPRGGVMVLGASLLAREEGTDAEMSIRLGVGRESQSQWCDPFSNLVEFMPADADGGRKRLRPGGTSSSVCPDLPVDINVTEAEFDGDQETLHLKGTFSGPVGRGDDAIQISQGHFEATLHSMASLMGS